MRDYALGSKGNKTFFSFPKVPSVMLFWAATEFCKCVLYTRPSSMLDLHIVLLKDRAVPAIKCSHHDSELQMISEMASNVSVLLAIGAQLLVTL